MVALFVIATIIVAVLLETMRERLEHRNEALAPVHPNPHVADRFLLPRSYFLSRWHTWAQLLFNGHVHVGIDDFVQKLIGAIDVIFVPHAGEIMKGEPLFSIRQGDRELSFASPVSGTILNTNDALLKAPGALHLDPYVSGWVVEIAPSNLSSDLKPLKIADEGARWIKEEIARFRDFIKNQSPSPGSVTLLDGGLPVVGVLEFVGGETWRDFQKAFLFAAPDDVTVR